MCEALRQSEADSMASVKALRSLKSQEIWVYTQVSTAPNTPETVSSGVMCGTGAHDCVFQQLLQAKEQHRLSGVL